MAEKKRGTGWEEDGVAGVLVVSVLRRRGFLAGGVRRATCRVGMFFVVIIYLVGRFFVG